VLVITAEMFVDAMNARRVIRMQAFDEEHAESLELLLSLTDPDIASRYCVGARRVGSASLRFVDGSIAACDVRERWTVTT
jgi:hypothetical protein